MKINQPPVYWEWVGGACPLSDCGAELIRGQTQDGQGQWIDVLYRVACLDAGDTVADRYTAVFLDESDGRGGFSALAMSAQPFYPQGFCQHVTASGQWVDKAPARERLKFADLAEDCRKAVLHDLFNLHPREDAAGGAVDIPSLTAAIAHYTAEAAERRRQLEEMLRGYVRYALWTEKDRQGKPLDTNHDQTDLAPEALAQAATDCRVFLDQNRHFVNFYIKAHGGSRAYPNGQTWTDFESLGGDLWLTRNHHGSGFWDRDYISRQLGLRLTKGAQAMGEVHLEVGDDQMLHFLTGA